MIEGVTSDDIQDIILNKDNYPYVKAQIYEVKVVSNGKKNDNGEIVFNDDIKKICKK